MFPGRIEFNVIFVYFPGSVLGGARTGSNPHNFTQNGAVGARGAHILKRFYLSTPPRPHSLMAPVGGRRIPILERLEIEVGGMITYKPRDVGNLSFSTSSYPGNIGNLIFPIFPYPGNIGNMIFLIFVIFPKKTRAEISRRMVQFSRRDLSYETDSGPKTKTVSDPNIPHTPPLNEAAS